MDASPFELLREAVHLELVLLSFPALLAPDAGELGLEFL